MKTDRYLISTVVLACALAPATAGESAQSLLDFYANEAKASDPGFSRFSAERGEHLFRTNFSTGKPETPSCTTCHTTDPRRPGKPARARTLSRWRRRGIHSVTATRRKRKNGLDETATTCLAENVPRRKRGTSLRSCWLNELRPMRGGRRHSKRQARRDGWIRQNKRS